jgi:8-oxo-dGTP pyrophosphatase MutT (NUDIX family)
MTNCVTATCFVIKENKVLFISHKKLGKWMPPGGHVESDETPIETLHREVLEETGLGIDIIDTYAGSGRGYIRDAHAEEMVRPMMILLEQVPYKTGLHKHFDLIYMAKADASKDRKTDELNEIRWVARTEIEGLETFENVKEGARMAFDAYNDSIK